MLFIRCSSENNDLAGPVYTVMITQFLATLDDRQPPGVSPLLDALWFDARGQWDKAHALAQDIDGRDAALVHAYLHRKEGDLGNARYWYRQAGRPELTTA